MDRYKSLVIMFVFLLVSILTTDVHASYNIFQSSGEQWETVFQTLTIQGQCFPGDCARFDSTASLTFDFFLTDGSDTIETFTVSLLFFHTETSCSNAHSDRVIVDTFSVKLIRLEV